MSCGGKCYKLQTFCRQLNDVNNNWSIRMYYEYCKANAYKDLGVLKMGYRALCV